MTATKIIFTIVLFYLCCSQSKADQFNAALRTGYESISSPLVRIDLDSPLILIDGQTKLTGSYYQFNWSAVKDWDLGKESEFSLSAINNIKLNPRAETLNFSVASIDGIWRKKFDETSIEVGPSVQRIWVANSEFRDSLALQFDVTHVKQNGSFTNLYFEIAKKYFVDEFDFFDSKSATVSLTHHMKDVGLDLNALDFELSVTREINLKDSNELSNKTFYGRISIDREMLGFTLSIGASVTQSYFDKPFFDGFAKRHDRYESYEFSVEKKISDKLNLSLNLTKAKNNSNLALFESDYKDISFSLGYNY